MGRRAENAQQIINSLYKRPMTTIPAVSELLGISHTAASNLIRHFEEARILREITGYQRNRFYFFERYLQIFTK